MKYVIFLKEYAHHKWLVFWYLSCFCARLMWRGVTHDLSKLLPGEIGDFIELASLHQKQFEYGSPEYKAVLEKHKDAIALHHARNTHHPHPKLGVLLMDMCDIIEMVCDWKSAGRRNKNGSLAQSIEVNRGRFKLSDDLHDLIKRTFLKRSLEAGQ